MTSLDKETGRDRYFAAKERELDELLDPETGLLSERFSRVIACPLCDGRSHTTLFVKRGYSSNDCGNSNAVIALGPTATMTGDQKRAIWALPTGVSNPPLPTDFLACLVSSQSLSSVPINITYRVDAARVQPSRPSRSPRSLPSP